MRTLLVKDQIAELDALIALREGTIEVPPELAQRCYVFDCAYDYIVNGSKRRWWIEEKEAIIGKIESSDLPEEDLVLLRSFTSPNAVDALSERWPWFKVRDFAHRMHDDRMIECAYLKVSANSFLRAQAFMRTLAAIVERNCINFGNTIHTRATPSHAFRSLVGKISIIPEDQQEIYRVEKQLTKEDLELMVKLREITTTTYHSDECAEVTTFGFERDEPHSAPLIETSDYYTISISRRSTCNNTVRKTGGCFLVPRK